MSESLWGWINIVLLFIAISMILNIKWSKIIKILAISWSIVLIATIFLVMQIESGVQCLYYLW